MRIPEDVKLKKEAIDFSNVKIETVPPKSNCKKCHGTGRLGFYDGDETRPMRCRCTVKITKLTPEDLKKAADAAAAKNIVEPVPGVQIVANAPEAKPEADKPTT